jgi:hypothetical protein
VKNFGVSVAPVAKGEVHCENPVREIREIAKAKSNRFIINHLYIIICISMCLCDIVLRHLLSMNSLLILSQHRFLSLPSMYYCEQQKTRVCQRPEHNSVSAPH